MCDDPAKSYVFANFIHDRSNRSWIYEKNTVIFFFMASCTNNFHILHFVAQFGQMSKNTKNMQNMGILSSWCRKKKINRGFFINPTAI